MTNVVVACSIYLLTCSVSLAAVLLGVLEQRRYRGLAALLAVAAILVGGMGLSAWTPFGVFPEFGWSFANGSFNISIRSGWLFVLPLIAGTFSAFLTLRNYGKHSNQA
jgi:hypothetical protein